MGSQREARPTSWSNPQPIVPRPILTPKINKAPVRLLLQHSTRLPRESWPCSSATMKFFTVLLFASLATASLAVLPGEYTFLPTLLSPLEGIGLSDEQHHHPYGKVIRCRMKKPPLEVNMKTYTLESSNPESQGWVQKPDWTHNRVDYGWTEIMLDPSTRGWFTTTQAKSLL